MHRGLGSKSMTTNVAAMQFAKGRQLLPEGGDHGRP
jgi:hypothetical protein